MKKSNKLNTLYADTYMKTFLRLMAYFKRKCKADCIIYILQVIPINHGPFSPFNYFL